MKKELLKFLILSGAVLIALLLYKIYPAILFNSWEYFGNDIKSLFEFPEPLIIIFIPYLAYITIRLLFYLINKFFNFRINTIKVSLLIVIIICGIFYINLVSIDYILYTYYKQRYSNFSAVNATSKIDSTNFKTFKWQRKTLDYHAIYVTNEKISFKNDSTVIFYREAFIIPDNSITSDLLIRYALNNYDYESDNEYIVRDSIIIMGKENFTFKLVNGKIETDLF